MTLYYEKKLTGFMYNAGNTSLLVSKIYGLNTDVNSKIEISSQLMESPHYVLSTE